MERTEEEFFDHARAMLFEQEMDYKPGEWERFRERESEKIYVFRIKWFLNAAAVATIFLGLLILERSFSDTAQKQAAVLRKSEKHSNDKSIIDAKKNSRSVKMHVIMRPAVASANNINEDLVQYGVGTTEEVKETVEHRIYIPEPIPRKPYRQKIKEAEYAAHQDNRLNSNQDREWKFNVLLSSNYGLSDKVRLGFGSSVEYALNKRISLSGGLAYVQVSGLDKPEHMSSPSSDANGNLKSVETLVRGIDFPLEIKYALNKYSYFSVGISVLGILQKAQTLTFEEVRLEEVIVDGGKDPKVESRLVVSTRSVPLAADALPQQNYIGFYNISCGFMRKIGTGNQLIFEPYIKLPMRTYSDQESNLISTGLRIKMSF